MSFLKKYWYLLLVTLITAGIGVAAYITSVKLNNQQPVAPTVPQVTPHATDVNCKLVFSIEVEPTPTPTIGPSPTPTSTPVHSPTPTPTDVPHNSPTPTHTPPPGATNTPTPTSTAYNTKPVCVDLEISPASGTVPYTVTLTCTGQDADGDITAAEFTMPDGTTKLVEENVGSPGSLTTTYTITSSGGYSFSCQVRDNNNVWASSDDCRISTGPTNTPPPGATAPPNATPTTATPKIPVSGSTSVAGIAIGAIGFLVLMLGLAL